MARRHPSENKPRLKLYDDAWNSGTVTGSCKGWMGRGLEMTPRVGKATATMILVCSLNGSSFLYAISLIFSLSSRRRSNMCLKPIFCFCLFYFPMCPYTRDPIFTTENWLSSNVRCIFPFLSMVVRLMCRWFGRLMTRQDSFNMIIVSQLELSGFPSFFHPYGTGCKCKPVVPIVPFAPLTWCIYL